MVDCLVLPSITEIGAASVRNIAQAMHANTDLAKETV
jgi:hypothetical protein